MGRATTVKAAGSGEERFLHRIRRGVDMLRFDGSAIDELAADGGAFLQALAVVALAGTAAAAGAGRHLGGIVSFAIANTLMAMLNALVLHLLATMAFEGRGTYRRFFRAFGHSYLLVWILGVPVIEAFFRWPVRIWQVAVIAYVVERVYGLERLRAIATVAILVVALALLAGVFHSIAALVALIGGWLL